MTHSHIGRTVLFLAIIILSLLATAGVYAETVHDRADATRIPGQYIVVFKDSVEDAEVARTDIARRAGGEYLDTYQHAVRGFSARLSANQLASVESDSRVAFVTEDHTVSVADTRSDILDSILGNIAAFARSSRRPGSGGSPTPPPAQVLPTGVNRIDAELNPNKGAGVNVAVIDSGILTTHADLAANIAGGKSCLTNTSSFIDQNGHGTHVAGTIAALDNNIGVVGVAPQAKLWSVRALDINGNGTWSSVICGLDFVTAHAPANGGPITVANLSLGGGGSSDNNCGKTNNDALHQAICRTRDAGVTIVVAAGNNGANANTFVPAAYDDAVITVSALADSDGALGGLGSATPYGSDDRFASFSNFGSVVDVGAPGVSIYSTWINNGYALASGTSMASPHVAGAAALYIAHHPGASWTQVRDALRTSGEALGNGHTDPSGLHPEPIIRADSI